MQKWNRKLIQYAAELHSTMIFCLEKKTPKSITGQAGNWNLWDTIKQI